MKKKVLAVALTLALVVALLVPALSAVATTGPDVEVTTSTVTAKRGDEITVKVTVTKNDGFFAMVLDVTNSNLVYKSAVLGADFAGKVGLTAGTSLVFDSLALDDMSQPTNVTTTGVLATITFTVKSDAAYGTTDIVAAMQAGGCDVDENDINFTCNKGTLTVACANHVYDNNCDEDCNECGATRTAPHNWNNTYNTDADKHWIVCRDCPATKEEGTHTYTDDCDDSCNVCGYTRTAPHDWQGTLTKDATGHWTACDDCTAKKDFAAHVYDDDCDEDCNICGYVREAPHNWKTYYDSDEDYHWIKCADCTAIKNKAEHTDTYRSVAVMPTLEDKGLFNIYCMDCGFNVGTEEIPVLEKKVEIAKNSFAEFEKGLPSDLTYHCTDGQELADALAEQPEWFCNLVKDAGLELDDIVSVGWLDSLLYYSDIEGDVTITLDISAYTDKFKDLKLYYAKYVEADEKQKLFVVDGQEIKDGVVTFTLPVKDAVYNDFVLTGDAIPTPDGDNFSTVAFAALAAVAMAAVLVIGKKRFALDK